MREEESELVDERLLRVRVNGDCSPWWRRPREFTLSIGGEIWGEGVIGATGCWRRIGLGNYFLEGKEEGVLC